LACGRSSVPRISIHTLGMRSVNIRRPACEFWIEASRTSKRWLRSDTHCSCRKRPPRTLRLIGCSRTDERCILSLRSQQMASLPMPCVKRPGWPICTRARSSSSLKSETFFLDDKFEPVIADFALAIRSNWSTLFGALLAPIFLAPELIDNYDATLPSMFMPSLLLSIGCLRKRRLWTTVAVLAATLPT
jgi:hypothetical protein